MPDTTPKVFPILRGVSVGQDGEFNGNVVIVTVPEELARDWLSDDIAVLKNTMQSHFHENPEELGRLFGNVSAVLSEFGEAIGDMASFAHASETLCIVKVSDAAFVLENGMHIRVLAYENVGEVFFIE